MYQIEYTVEPEVTSLARSKFPFTDILSYGTVNAVTILVVSSKCCWNLTTVDKYMRPGLHNTARIPGHGIKPQYLTKWFDTTLSQGLFTNVISGYEPCPLNELHDNQ